METKFTDKEITEELELLKVKINTSTGMTRIITPSLLRKDELLLLKDVLVPTKFIDLNFGDYKEFVSAKQFEKIEKYIKNFWKNITNGRGIFFSGPVGTGKTSFATLLTKMAFSFFKQHSFWKEYKDKTYTKENTITSVYFWQSGKILMDYFGDKKEFQRIVEKPFLVIDDIGKVKQDIYVDALDFILRYRDMNELPTIITSQIPLTHNDFKEVFGLPIFDLISGNCKEIKLIGKSRRAGKK